jgi:succinate dehydrogenase / fumarate reductase cytochrome b subunit
MQLEANRRPKYLGAKALLFDIRMPSPALVSILHRISGALLLLGFGLLLSPFERSLQSNEGFEAAAKLFEPKWVRALLLLLVWAYVHHILAGLRFLTIDVVGGVSLRSAKYSSVCVIVVSLAVTAYAGATLW